MNAEQFIAEEVDPLLEKISREGMQSLTRSERRILAKAREKLAGESLTQRRVRPSRLIPLFCTFATQRSCSA
jgi:hypothetical protein